MTIERGWKVDELSTGDQHVVPVNDLRDHLIHSECPCQPTEEHVGLYIIYIHNSWDYREIIEQAEEILKKRQGI